MSTKEHKKRIEKIVDAECKLIKNYLKWVAAWWTPDYYRNRIVELTKDINSKNKDIEYIENHRI